MREEERGSPLQSPGITAPANPSPTPCQKQHPPHRHCNSRSCHVPHSLAALIPLWPRLPRHPPPTTAQVAPAPRISAAPHRLEPWQPPQHHPPHLHCASRSCTAHPGCTCPICPHGAPSTIPAHYYAQCQITMLATGWDSMLLMRYPGLADIYGRIYGRIYMLFHVISMLRLRILF